MFWMEREREWADGPVHTRPHTIAPLLFLGIPEEAVRAELTVEAAGLEGEERRLGQSWELGDGAWLFALVPPGDGYSIDWYLGGDYTLRLYDGDGALLLEQTGTIPQPA